MKNEGKELLQKIEERKRFLQEVLPFLDDVLRKVGKQISHEVHDDHTNSCWGLNDFHEFSIYGDFGQSQMGGNELRVKYKGVPVLTVYCQPYGFDIKEIKVTEFDGNPEWQRKILEMVLNKTEIISNFFQARNKEKEGELKRKKAEEEKLKNSKSLEKEAERLKITK